MDLAYCKDCKETGEPVFLNDVPNGTYQCGFCGSLRVVDATAEGDNYFEEDR